MTLSFTDAELTYSLKWAQGNIYNGKPEKLQVNLSTPGERQWLGSLVFTWYHIVRARHVAYSFVRPMNNLRNYEKNFTEYNNAVDDVFFDSGLQHGAPAARIMP